MLDDDNDDDNDDVDDDNDDTFIVAADTYIACFNVPYSFLSTLQGLTYLILWQLCEIDTIILHIKHDKKMMYWLVI